MTLFLKRDIMTVYICGLRCSPVNVCSAPCRRRREKLQAHLKESRGLKNYSVSQSCKTHTGLQLHSVSLLFSFLFSLFFKLGKYKKGRSRAVKPSKSQKINPSRAGFINNFTSSISATLFIYLFYYFFNDVWNNISLNKNHYKATIMLTSHREYHRWS